MKIPYGMSDFSQIREEGYFYADKTPFLPVLEANYRHLVFLRPRRFGKSTLVSMLGHYYDLGRWEHLAILLDEQGLVTLHLDELRRALATMTEVGDIAPFLDLFQRKVLQTFSHRDARGLDEKTIKLLLLTYASLGGAFRPLSEPELAQGWYGDVFLSAARDRAGTRFSWLLELKYLKAGAKPPAIEVAFAEAEVQVERYAKDEKLLPILVGDRELKAGSIVFVGPKKALFRAWEAPRAAAAGKGRKARRTPRA
jgi:Predicted AAA-ATPase/PD-(D/E)XK nuclease superfamily